MHRCTARPGLDPRARLAAVVMLALASATPALAAGKALLIGVAQYQSATVDPLPGIDQDIEQMRDIARRLGVTEIAVLMDRAATRAAMLAAMRETLTRNVAPDDLVLIYFSGHGTQLRDDNGDETDGFDEVLLSHDTVPGKRPDGGPTLLGVISDDEIAGLLRQSPSRNVLLVVDACNSGTINKAAPLPGRFLGETRGTPKFHSWAGLRSTRSKAFDVVAAGSSDAANHVAMSAASDTEAAMATNNGSVFTVGLARAVAARSASGQITPRQLVDQARTYIQEQDMRQSPQLNGAASLLEKPLKLTGVAAGDGPNWRRARGLAARMQPAAMAGVQPRYRDGEGLNFAVDVPAAGYLNIIDVGPDDNITLLYPNRFHPDNKVAAGRFSVPGDALPFELPARAPHGRSLLVAFVTTEPLSLLTSSADGKSATLAAPSLAGLEALGQAAARSFAPQAKAEGAGSWAAVAETEVCGHDGSCR